MKTPFVVLLSLVVILLVPVMIHAAGNDSHQVTVQVDPINEIGVTGTVTLLINSASAGSDPDEVFDNTSSDLNWTTNQASKKITVSTNLAAPNFTLPVFAENINSANATAAGEILLSTVAADFVTNLANEAGGCDLRYSAAATAAQGSGQDVHTVTFTIQDAL